MALNLGSTNQTFDPYVKYDAKAGRWFIKKDEQDVEVPNPVFVADFENLKTGWFYFAKAQAPEKVFDPSLSEPAPKPTKTYTDKDGKVRDCFKRGFEIRLYSAKAFGGVVVLSGSSMHLNNAIAELYGKYEEGLKENSGKLPVVKATGTETMKDKMGTNYKPIFVIEKWVDRPAELVGTSVAQKAATGQATQPQPVSVAPVATVDSEF